MGPPLADSLPHPSSAQSTTGLRRVDQEPAGGWVPRSLRSLPHPSSAQSTTGLRRVDQEPAGGWVPRSLRSLPHPSSAQSVALASTGAASAAGRLVGGGPPSEGRSPSRLGA